MNDDGRKNITRMDELTEDMPGLCDAEELAQIDAFLRSTADQINAEVDYSGIKNRVLASEQKRRSTRSRIKQYLLMAAAALLVCFGALAVISGIGANLSQLKPQDAMNTVNPGGVINSGVPGLPTSNIDPQETDNAHKGPTDSTIPASYTRCNFAGIPDDTDFTSISRLLPSELPDYMSTLIDNESKHIASKGTDSSGEEKYFECTIIKSAPYKLKLGEVGEFEGEGTLVLYWQLAEGSCLRMKFYGFGINDASNMFKNASKKITEN